MEPEVITMSAIELCKLLIDNHIKGAEIGFLDVTPETTTKDELDTCGALWYGIQINCLFGDVNVLIGMYAHGILYKNEELIDTRLDIFHVLETFMKKEFNINIQPNSLLYVSKEDIEEISVKKNK